MPVIRYIRDDGPVDVPAGRQIRVRLTSLATGASLTFPAHRLGKDLHCAVRCKRQWRPRPPSAVLAVGLTLAGCSSGTAALQPSIIARIRLPVAPFAIAAGYGSIWALTRQPAPAV
jgi:hypothetical protein